MLLVLASRFDGEARAFVDERLAGRALLLTPADLSASGWNVTWRFPGENMGEAGGLTFRSADVSAALSLLPAVTQHELPHIAVEDQEYVAAELHAFLRFWLSELSCPVYNRPSHGGLSAAPWSERRWRWTAAEAGLLPVTTGHANAADMLMSVVDGAVIDGEASADQRLAARRLSEASGATTLTLHFRDGRFAAAFPRPLLAQPKVADAVERLLQGPEP